jgi:hypothetical protein
MSNVVNLNKYRKRKQKAEAAKKADTNRRLHGRTKQERAGDELRRKRTEVFFEGALLGSDGDVDREK